MDATVVPFDAKAASREAWAKFHAFRRIRHTERDPDDPILDDAVVETLLKRDDPMGESYRFAALAPPGDVIGWLPSYDGPGDFEAKDAAYYESRERKALHPNPAQHIESGNSGSWSRSSRVRRACADRPGADLESGEGAGPTELRTRSAATPGGTP